MTTTSTTAPGGPAGLTTVSLVSLTTVRLVAAAVPKATPAAPVRRLPVMVTGVPPADGPVAGETPVTIGRSRKVNWSAGALAALVPPPAVTVISTVPSAWAGLTAVMVVLLTTENDVAGAPD